jgi:hypothetical protein
MEERNRQFNNYIYNYMIIVQTYIYVYLQPTICINKYICMYGDITKYMESPFLESNSHSNSEASPPTSSHHISISSTSICTSSCSTWILYAFIIPAYVLHVLIVSAWFDYLIMSGEEGKLWSCSLCSAVQPPALLLSWVQVFSSAPFSNTHVCVSVCRCEVYGLSLPK